MAQVPVASWVVPVASEVEVISMSLSSKGIGLPDAFDELNGPQSESIPAPRAVYTQAGMVCCAG